MRLGLEPWEQAVLKKWKSISHVYTFLEDQLRKINDLCFQGCLDLPQVNVKRMKFSRSRHGGFSGADYRPPGPGRTASIGIFPILLLKKEDAIAGLAHEMVHHWEYVIYVPENHWKYPAEWDQLIHERFKDSHREKSWRSTHSSRFLAKSHQVAMLLKIPARDFLFK